LNKEWQHDSVSLALQGDLSWRAIAELVEKPKSTVSDHLRNYFGMLNDVEEAESEGEPDNSRILFISDMHIPYHHPGLLPFLEGLKTRYEPTRVICLGDEIDAHAMSFHDSDADLFSAGDELQAALPTLKEIEKMFPVMDIIDSNHGSMVYRKAKTHGIPRRYIRDYNEVLEVGDGWQWHMDLVLDMSSWDVPDVYVHHGKSAQAVKTSQAMSMSHVCGHFHEAFGITYWANPKGLYYGMNCGCLIQDKSLAFAYNRTNLKRPIVGSGLIIEGIPVLEAMKL
jgi:hypothetical protein